MTGTRFGVSQDAGKAGLRQAQDERVSRCLEPVPALIREVVTYWLTYPCQPRWRGDFQRTNDDKCQRRLAEELGHHRVGVGGGELAGVVSADVGGGLVVYGDAALEDGPLAGGGGVLGGGYYDCASDVYGCEPAEHIAGAAGSGLSDYYGLFVVGEVEVEDGQPVSGAGGELDHDVADSPERVGGHRS